MFKKYQLKNGLTVILVESHKAPVISVQCWVRTGSADELPAEAGISHFIEHLVFKGTQVFKAGEIASTIEASGGELNAYTSFDQTVFHVTLSSQFAETGVLAISQMMGFPSFDPKEVDLEREVVVEEIKRGKDSLGRRSSELMFATMFKRHNYGRPVIGFEKNIREWSVEKIKKYFYQRYCPKNMFLVVSGDFELAKMKALVLQHFGKMSVGKFKKSVRKPEPPQKTPRVVFEKSDFEQNLCAIAWPIPGASHKDVPALDILAIILGQGDTSRLVKRLRIDNPTVLSIGSSAYTPLNQGMFGISFSFLVENFDRALSEIAEELSQILNHPAAIEEIKRAVLSLEIDDLYSLETVDGLSRKFGSLEFFYRDPSQQQKYIKALKKVTAEDVIRVAKKYLAPEKTNFTGVVKTQEVEMKKKAEAWIKSLPTALKPKEKAKEKANEKQKKLKIKKVTHTKIPVLKFASRTPKTIKTVLSNGMTVLMRPSTDTGVISVKAAFLGGSRLEDKNHLGLVDLLGRAWTGGSKNRSEIEIYKLSEAIGSGVGAVAGRHSLGLGMEFLSTFKEKALDIFFDVLTEPTFPNDIIEREKSIQLEQIKSKRDNPAQVCSQQLMKELFKNHPYAESTIGVTETVSKISREDILDHWKTVFNLENLTLAFTGNFNSDQLLRLMEKSLKMNSHGKRVSTHFKLDPLNQDKMVYESSKKEQSHIILAYRGLSMDHPDRYALQLIEAILAGQGGRLFIELRDKQSLAYSVSPLRMEGLGTGYFGAYIGCSPEKAKTAIRMMNEQFDLLCEKRVGEAELQRAQKYLLGRHDIELQRTSAIGSSMLYNDIYGLDYDEAFNCRESYMKVTADQVRDLSNRIFKQNKVISVVGPSNPF